MRYIRGLEVTKGERARTYNDIRMKGIEYLRSLYASSGLSIRPKTKITTLERIKMFIESLDMNPDEILTREALARPHRTVVDPESRKIEVLNEALKHAILKEFRNA